MASLLGGIIVHDDEEKEPEIFDGPECTLCGNQNRGELGIAFLDSTDQKRKLWHCRDVFNCGRRAEPTIAQKVKRHWKLFEGLPEEE